ncbi:MAG: AraC family transcriptional regulator ligand-binding domain-containing protein [Simplicispira suum]|uniref:AraC family transcriptional regulator n=1 Tax=Simplicispira suum TaxID=2109915 RepID=UPI001C6AB34E|nr:AraC family transcriptional regulator [Simplicispira suum]MBW7834188.1 AraC family transcriptional regulator ligand-binding domain-containing protein [Simplicispira suum]
MPPATCSIAPNRFPGRVVTPYAHTLIEQARAEGVPLEAAAAAEADMPVQQYLDVLARACDHAGPAFGWRLGQSVKPTTYGVNGILLLACATLGEALAQVLRFESLVHDLGRSEFALEGDHAVYAWRSDCTGHPAASALSESVFSGILTCAQWLLGRPVESFALEFTHPAHAQSAAYIAKTCPAQVRWGATANRAIFPAELLDWPLPQAQQGVLPLLQRHADELLQARHPRDAGIAAQVRQSISGRLGRGTVKLADVAQDLHLSTRTLQRRLADEGLAYQTLLDATRHELACHYLSGSALPIAEVGYLLGFQDAPAFTHAFKHWQGQGPGHYRAGTSGTKSASLGKAS